MRDGHIDDGRAATSALTPGGVFGVRGETPPV